MECINYKLAVSVFSACVVSLHVIFLTTSNVLLTLTTTVAQWLERRSLTGELSLASARSAADHADV